MKIKAWFNDPIELDVSIEFEDILTALAETVSEGEHFPNRLVSALDQLTRILAAVEGDWICQMKPDHQAIIWDRLSVQANRYQKKAEGTP